MAPGATQVEAGLPLLIPVGTTLPKAEIIMGGQGVTMVTEAPSATIITQHLAAETTPGITTPVVDPGNVLVSAVQSRASHVSQRTRNLATC